MADVTIIAEEIRKHVAQGDTRVTEGVLIALVAHLADVFPDMTVDQLSAALHEATEDRHKASESDDGPIG